MSDIFETKAEYKETEEYKEFEKEQKHIEAHPKSCIGCIYYQRQPRGMCGLASSLCVSTTNKPYYRRSR